MTPKLLAIPFAKDGNKNTIQDERQPAQDANEATWTGGFPPVTMQAKTDGGLPPQGLDFNGIFHDVSSHTVYNCMGGQYKFSAEYAEKIGGYPKGAILLNNEENRRYISTNDKNKSNFNEPKFTGWLVISIADIDKLLDAKADNTDIAESLNKKADKDTSVKAGYGLSGGGTLEVTRTITLGTPSTITENSKNTVTATSHTHEIQKATTSQAGAVQLSSALSNEVGKAATPKAVNDVNIVATNAQKSANAANDKANQAKQEAYDAKILAQSKQDPLVFSGTGNVARMSEVSKKRDYSDRSFSNLTITPGEGINDYIYMPKVGGETTVLGVNSSQNIFFYQTGNGNIIEFPKNSGVVALRSNVPGYHQKLVNMTSQRSPNVTYINNTSAPITIIVVSAMTANLQGSVTVDGVSVPYSGTGRVEGARTSITLLVPPKSSYSSNNFESFYEVR